MPDSSRRIWIRYSDPSTGQVHYHRFRDSSQQHVRSPNYWSATRRLGGAPAPAAGGNSSGNGTWADAYMKAHGADAHGAHPSIFALGYHLDLFHATVCFVFLVLLTIALELVSSAM